MVSSLRSDEISDRHHDKSKKQNSFSRKAAKLAKKVNAVRFCPLGVFAAWREMPFGLIRRV